MDLPPNGIARLRLVLGWIIIVAWCASLVADFVVSTYDPPPTIHVLMMIVAGAMFGPKLTGRDR